MEFFGIKNITLNCLVTDKMREPLVFGTKQGASRWLRFRSYPKGLIIVSTKKGTSKEEKDRLKKAWISQNRIQI